MWESFISGAVFVLLLELIWADFKRLVLCSGIAEMAPTVERPDQPTQMCLWRSEGNCLCFVVYYFSFMTVIFMGRLILGFLSVFVSLLLLILL